MVVINIGSGWLTGLSTDNKPLPSNSAVGTRYIEFDPAYQKFIIYICDGISWIPQNQFSEEYKNKIIDYNLNTITHLPAGFGGETNTAINVGVTGFGVFKQKVGVEFEFYNISVGSTKLTIAQDTGANTIALDVDESNLTLSNIGGSVSKAQIPSAAAYEDEANIFTLIQKFEVGLKVKPITVPTTDASYGIFYSDSADTNKPKFKKPDGTVIDMSGGTGEVNTASNVGVGGVGVFKQKSGVDLQFRNINAGSSYVTITNDTGNNEIDIDLASTVPKTDVANTFTQAQKITITGTTPMTHYRTTNTVGSGMSYQMEANDSAGNETVYVRLDALINDNTDTAENGQFVVRIISAGTLGAAFTTDETGLVRMGVPGVQRLRLDGSTGLTAARVFTFPDATATLAGQNFANNFSSQQKFSSGATPVLLYRALNTVSNGVTLSFDLNDSASNETTYMRIDGNIIDNTDGSEDGELSIALMFGGTLSTAFKTNDTGIVELGVPGLRRVRLDCATGLTATRTFTFPDATALLAGQNFANTFSVAQTFDSSMLKIRNPADTFSYTIVGGAIAANRNLTLPLLTGNDVMVTEAFAQTLTNKTIVAGSNTITGIVDANITAHTTTKITTLSKSLLNTAIVYNDQNNTLGAFYVDIASIAVPSNPSSGTRRVFVDTADGELKVRTSSGTTVSLEGGGSGEINTASNVGVGGVGVFKQKTTFDLEFKNINAGSAYITVTDDTGNNEIDIDVSANVAKLNAVQTFTSAHTYNSSILKIRNPADTFSYIIVGGAIAADRNLTLPLLTGNDVMVTEAFAQTLTNKTIVAGSNTITGIVDANITAHTTTKITTLSKSLLNTAIVYTDQTNTFGAFDQIFPSSRLLIGNPAATFNYTIVGAAIAAGRSITLPLLAGNDTMVTEAFAQTLTNKTIVAGSNTITGIVDANITAHTTTKITTLSKSLLNTAIVYTDQTNTFGAFDQLFPSSRLLIGNPAATFNYTIVGAAILANRNLTIPLLTGNDTIAVLGLTNVFSAGQQFDNYTDYKQISAPANPSANYGRLYVKQIDANNDGLFIALKKSGGFVEIQVG